MTSNPSRQTGTLAKPWTHYETIDEAWSAFRAFQTKVGLPDPSAVVNSGGGLHIYWISDTALAPDVWKPYASGLKSAMLNQGFKCDAGLTTDIARILRVPGTLNHKYKPARLVELLHHGQMYNFETDLAFLRNVKLAGMQNGETQSTATTHQALYDPQADFIAPDLAFAGLVPDDALQADIQTRGLWLVDPDPIFGDTGCGFFREALLNGGKNNDQPQWNLAILGTTFMDNGNDIAHLVSKHHATYSMAETQAMFDRKVAEQRASGIGYPSCAAIAGVGCKDCQACPHFAKGKSPLNIKPSTAAENQAAAVAPTGRSKFR